MSKLSKRQAAAHAKACALADRGNLTDDEMWFVLENWQESAKHINSVAGAFFTPPGLARDFCVEVPGGRIIDLCAGIGALSIMASARFAWGCSTLIEIVCVEQNPDYVEMGRKLLPSATWICGDVLALPDLGRFDCAISNPPFGSIKRSTNGRSYKGRSFEYHVLEVASRIADYGVFIIPQESAPFAYSGRPCFEKRDRDEYARFHAATGITLGPSCGIDAAHYRDEWHGVAPAVEIVSADFKETVARQNVAEPTLFDLPEAA